MLLYDSRSVQNFYIRETVFAGTRKGAVGIFTDIDAINQAYSVGSSTKLTNAGDVEAEQ